MYPLLFLTPHAREKRSFCWLIAKSKKKVKGKINFKHTLKECSALTVPLLSNAHRNLQLIYYHNDRPFEKGVLKASYP